MNDEQSKQNGGLQMEKLVSRLRISNLGEFVSPNKTWAALWDLNSGVIFNFERAAGCC